MKQSLKLQTPFYNSISIRRNIAVDRHMKCLMSKVSFITSTSVFIISLFLAACGEDKVIKVLSEDQDIDPKEVQNIISGLWTGSLISESTGDEKTFEGTLSFGNLHIMPPYFYDIFKRRLKITDTPLNVGGVLIILSDAQVDTLIADSQSFSFKWPLVISLRAGELYPAKYRLTTRGIVNSPMMDGTYEEFGLTQKEIAIDAGTWSAIRKEKLP